MSWISAHDSQVPNEVQVAHHNALDGLYVGISSFMPRFTDTGIECALPNSQVEKPNGILFDALDYHQVLCSVQQLAYQRRVRNLLLRCMVPAAALSMVTGHLPYLKPRIRARSTHLASYVDIPHDHALNGHRAPPEARHLRYEHTSKMRLSNPPMTFHTVRTFCTRYPSYRAMWSAIEGACHSCCR